MNLQFVSTFFILLTFSPSAEGINFRKIPRTLGNSLMPLPDSVSTGKSDLNFDLQNIKWLNDDSYLVESGGYITKVGNKNVTIDIKGGSVERSELSHDGTWISICEDVKSIFRHSFTCKVVLYNLENGQRKYVQVPNTDSSLIQIFSWMPIGNNFIVVVQNDLYHGTADEMKVKRLTTDGGADVFNGIADWVYEEEIFESSVAHWFSPRGSWMAFAKFNDAKVPSIKYQFNSDGSSAYPAEYSVHYPKAGFENPLVELNIVSLDDVSTRIKSAILICPQKYRESDHILLWVQWASETVLLAAWSKRLQDEIYILSYDVQTVSNSELRGTQVYHYETTGWIQSLMFRPPVINEANMKFYFAIPSFEGEDKFVHVNELSAITNVSPLQLTTGRWEVSKIVCMSRERKKIYYTSNERGFGKNHLYELDLPSFKSKCITCENSFDITCNFIHETTSDSCTQSYIKCLGPKVPFSYILDLKTQNMRMITFNGDLVKRLENYAVPKKTFEKFSRGQYDIYARQSVPVDFDESNKKKYSVLFSVYGGPDSSYVSESYQLGLTEYLVSNFPMVEVQLDVRGSTGSGEKHRHVVKNTLGKLESDDVAYMIRYYKALPWVDYDKICIWGWSYGGFLSLTTLADHRDVLDCSIAVAPVVDWCLYDSMYTERYMGLPVEGDNLDGYKKSSVLQKAENFRNSSLLIIHGLCDDNVHFQNSARLMTKLAEKDIGFDQLVIPDQNHALAQRRKLAFTKITSFLSKKMKFEYTEA